jgi:hypothetical protein
MLQHRRRFVRDALGLAGATVVGGLAGCARSGESLGDGVDGGGDDGQTLDSSDLRLQPGMKIGLGSTALAGLVSRSEVDPDEPGGGRLVTIEAVSPGEEVTLSWRRTVENEITPTATPSTVGVGESTPTPDVEVVEETGTITASGLADSHQPFLPMYWQSGEKQTDTSAIWLSREAFEELRETRQTAWSRDVLTRISRVGVEAASQIDSGVAEQIRNGAAEVDEVLLHAEPDFVDIELTVNGETTTVSGIGAYDSFGNAYKIIDNEQNPLVTKFTYDAVSVGFTGFDTALWTLIKTVFSGYQVVSIDPP